MNHRLHRRMTPEYAQGLRQIKMAQVKEASSLDVMNAFKKKKSLKSGNYSTDGQKLRLFGKNIAEHTDKGLRVTNAGYDTPTTYRALNQLGVETKIQKGQVYINRKPYTHGSFVTVPYNEVSKKPFTQHFPKREGTDIVGELRQRKFNRRILETHDYLGGTDIQPQDQRLINKLTGIKSKIPKPSRASAVHHILYRRNYPGLQLNPRNTIPLSRKEHSLVHSFDRLKLNAKLAALRSETNSVTNRLNLLRRRSKKVKMAQIHPKADGIIRQMIEDHGIDKEPFPRGSAFLSPTGEYLRGTGTHYSTVNQYGKILGIGKSGRTKDNPEYEYVDDSDIHKFLSQTGLVRMQYISTRAGYRQSLHVASKLTPAQISRIQSLEKSYEGRSNITMGFAVGPDFEHMDFGEGFRDFMGAYRKHFGEKSAQAEGETNVFNMTYTKSKPHKVKKRYYGDKV